MKQIIAAIGIFAILVSCQSKETKEDLGNSHKVTVLEIIQTTSYTYLSVKEGDVTQWVAVPKMEAKVGDVFYYDNGMLMTNFKSKELDRTFEKVLFLESLRTTLKPGNDVSMDVHGDKMANEEVQKPGKPELEKKEIKITHAAGTVKISEIYQNKANYSGKVIKVTGKVMKVSLGIMNKNWIHIQDGTEFGGDFDLTITTQEVVKEGDEVIFEGKIYLDKDFGYGYAYKIIMEEAVLSK
jgi:hypothetical protein